MKLYIKTRLNIIREKQMKTTVKYHFTHTRMAILKRAVTSVDEKNVETLEPSHIAGETWQDAATLQYSLAAT